MQALFIADIFFYLCGCFATIGVIEFIIKVKDSIRIVLLDVLRIVTVLWGLAGVVTSVVLLVISRSVLRVHVPADLHHQIAPSRLTGQQASASVVLGTIACVIQALTFVAAVLVTMPLKSKLATKVQVLLAFAPSFACVNQIGIETIH